MAILTVRYGRQWLIPEAAGGGYCAVRRGLSEENGLPNAMRATTLGEMARRLAVERKRENRPAGH
ncbi:hypothetical protein ABZU75_04440 [Streptosporangium sp. NPDC005286]|uniref:hypothetical protein n=1 Tax=Streptosporangium sp. NPDC005286 TaxID=3154463 RepID=UPI0033AC8B0C